MRIGATRFWRDGWMIRSSNYNTHEQPFECGIGRIQCAFSVYETESERGGTQVRFTVKFLWFWVNTQLFHTKRETVNWDSKREGRDWGFHTIDRSFVLEWGHWRKSFRYPFVSTIFVRHEIMSLDGRRVVHTCSHGLNDWEQKKAVEAENSVKLPYRYELTSGKVQNVEATVVRERWIRRWKWTPFLNVDDCIDVTFSEEVGPGRGSWKGGCVGCGWSIRKGENVVTALRRMERERRFER